MPVISIDSKSVRSEAVDPDQFNIAASAACDGLKRVVEHGFVNLTDEEAADIVSTIIPLLRVLRGIMDRISG